MEKYSGLLAETILLNFLVWWDNIIDDLYSFVISQAKKINQKSVSLESRKNCLMKFVVKPPFITRFLL